MKSERLYEILEGINEDYINESEEYEKKRTLKSIFKTNKLALVAAVLALLLCGTAAATGIMWLTPRVEIDENKKGYSFALVESNYEFPEEVLSKIAERPPNPGVSFEFDSIDKWQNFFDLPFVAGDITIAQKSGARSYITSSSSDGQFIPDLIESTVFVKLAPGEYDRRSAPWHGIITVYTLTKDTSVDKIENTEMGYIVNEEFYFEPSTEILVESETDFGMPYTIVVSKAGPDEEHEHYEHTLYKLKLIYGYESSLYHLELNAFGEDEYEKALARLKDYADTIQIAYPAE